MGGGLLASSLVLRLWPGWRGRGRGSSGDSSCLDGMGGDAFSRGGRSSITTGREPGNGSVHMCVYVNRGVNNGRGSLF